MSDSCPCGSGQGYAACCGALHAGVPAPTAEALMRSRYSAFVRRDLPYLVQTSHPMQRSKLDPKGIRATFALAWCGLEIVAVQGGGPADREGVVRFRAHYRVGAQLQVHDECSRFVRVEGAWVYRDDRGSISPEAKPDRPA